MNDRQFSITHIISVLAGMSVAVVWSVEFFIHTIGLTPALVFTGSLVPIAYAGTIGYYAMSLKASAKGITETTTPK